MVGAAMLTKSLSCVAYGSRLRRAPRFYNATNLWLHLVVKFAIRILFKEMVSL